MNDKRTVPEKIRVAQIINIHGVKGEVRAIPLSDFDDRYGRLDHVFIESSEDIFCLKLDNVRWNKNNLLLKFEGIDSREAALKLKNTYITVDYHDAVELPENSYFFFEIIGLEVFDTSGAKLGRIKDILQTSANDVYVVEATTNEKEILIPALKEVIKELRVDKGVMIVDLPEGLV